MKNGGQGTEVERIVGRLAREVERRYYGKYRGLVVDNEDPRSLGRLKVRVPSVLGEDVVTGWAAPCVPYGGRAGAGTLFVPEVDDGVWVEFEEGDLEFPIWVGTYWTEPDGETELPRPNAADGSEEDGVQSPPTRKIVKTAAGHTLQFEDAEGGVRILIGDGQEESRLVISDDGLELVRGDNRVTMNSDGVVVEDGNRNRMEYASSGVTIEDGNGNTVEMKSGVPAPIVAVNGDRRICLDGLIDWLMSHTHVGNMGAPCPVNPANLPQLTAAKAAPAGSILSLKSTAG